MMHSVYAVYAVYNVANMLVGSTVFTPIKCNNVTNANGCLNKQIVPGAVLRHCINRI